MAFTVEDGTKIAGANSYVPVAFADAYFTERGGGSQDTWSGLSVAEKQQALVRATDYVEKRFSPRFVGVRESATQGLRWPRTGAYDCDGFDLAASVPIPLQQAVSEYAVRAARLVLVADPPPAFKQTEGSSSVAAQATGPIVRKKVVAGPVESEIEYQISSLGTQKQGGLTSQFALPEYPAADLLLAPILSTGGFAGVIRG